MCNMYSILQKLCAQKGITITEMCRAAGVPRSSVGNLATGSTQQLSAKNMQKLATYFNVSADYLLGNEEKPAGQEEDELIKNAHLAGQHIAAYGKVKEEFSQAEIDDITMIMEMIAEKKRRKREKGEE